MNKQQNLNFALIGAAGFVAPRHMNAIKETGNHLVLAHDKNDSVGILDSYFPGALFYKDAVLFEEFIKSSKNHQQEKIDFLSICTPNYLHKEHIEFGLKNQLAVICEKPLVLNPKDLEKIADLSREVGKKTYTILQLRLHPNIIALKKKVENSSEVFEVDLSYLTPRGHWYFNSWKGDTDKSGGIATNIGIHLFDMLQWVFGDLKQCVVHVNSADRCAGFLEFEKARVRWILSINRKLLPETNKIENKAFRSLTINGEEISFSNGFQDLHTLSYAEILNGNGFEINESLKSLEIVHQIRASLPVGLVGDYYPLAKIKV